MARAEIETPLYIGTNGHVVALDPWTGVELWRTKLPRCVGMGAIVSITVKHNLLFAGASGRVWCLDKRDGRVLWQNNLPRLGYYYVQLTIEGASATTGAQGLAAQAARQRQNRAAGGGAAT